MALPQTPGAPGTTSGTLQILTLYPARPGGSARAGTLPLAGSLLLLALLAGCSRDLAPTAPLAASEIAAPRVLPPEIYHAAEIATGQRVEFRGKQVLLTGPRLQQTADPGKLACGLTCTRAAVTGDPWSAAGCAICVYGYREDILRALLPMGPLPPHLRCEVIGGCFENGEWRGYDGMWNVGLDANWRAYIGWPDGLDP